ncbi:MAG: FecR domain-containing protein [Thermoanaerobaculia bacterium]|nr:MAG: FecR domain-containing protein [Thermoanaerobaculia bacterium]
MEVSEKKSARTRGWYTVSVDTLRVLGGLALVLVLAGGGWYGYRAWSARALEQEAAYLLDEVRTLLARATQERSGGTFTEELASARGGFESAEGAFAARDFRTAVDEGRRARALLLAVLDSGTRAASGEAQFIAVQGSVELRRGDQGEWEPARARDVLRQDDYVKTGANGSAEVVFLDGTLYTVRPNTLFVVTRQQAGVGTATEQAISMEYGWVNLNTAQRGGRVTTPRAEARVARDTEAAVSFDKATSTARFAAFRGEVEVTSEAGLVRRIGALEQVTQTGALLSDAQKLPTSPLLLEPGAGFETTLDGDRKLVLSWDPVAGATQYALQISRNRLFVDNLIDVDSRATTRATLGLRSEGAFEWRVAARTGAGLQGPWSEARTFRVVASLRGSDRGDTTPPLLDIDQVQAYGNVFIVNGRTEPGATLTVNGEAVTVAANGTFAKTVLVQGEGWSFLELAASDPAGNIRRLRHRIFVEVL